MEGSPLGIWLCVGVWLGLEDFDGSLDSVGDGLGSGVLVGLALGTSEKAGE